MVKVKICGITDIRDARNAIDAGVDALGFVFYKKSPRYIVPEKARAIIRQLPKAIKKVGIFVDEREKTIKHIANSCGLDILQFHGKETPEFCRKFPGKKIIKAFRIKDKIDLDEVIRYKTHGYLFDTFVKLKPGGTGRQFNWNLLKGLSEIRRTIFLSGGLTGKNVKQAIKAVHPDWVDASSSVESRPGKKDFRKVKKFIEAAKRG